MHAREENNEEKLLGDPAFLSHPDLKQRPNDAMPAASDIKFEARSSTAADSDSGNESAEADSDSEEKREENIRKLQNSVVGMNVSQCFISEALYGHDRIAGIYHVILSDDLLMILEGQIQGKYFR